MQQLLSTAAAADVLSQIDLLHIIWPAERLLVAIQVASSTALENLVIV